jgi:hypothetical protein
MVSRVHLRAPRYGGQVGGRPRTSKLDARAETCGLDHDGAGRSLAEVAPRELASRSSLQIPFELQSGLLIIELNYHERPPWPEFCCGGRQPFIVRVQSRTRIRGHASVVLRWMRKALQDVNEPFWCGHSRTKAIAQPCCDTGSPPTRRYAPAPAGNLRVTHERRLVTQTLTSWNRTASWLRRLEGLRRAA